MASTFLEVEVTAEDIAEKLIEDPTFAWDLIDQVAAFLNQGMLLDNMADSVSEDNVLSTQRMAGAYASLGSVLNDRLQDVLFLADAEADEIAVD